MIVTAKVQILNGEYVAKDFDVEVHESGRLYSNDLVNWVLNEKRRLGNLFTVNFNGKDYLYSL